MSATTQTQSDGDSSQDAETALLETHPTLKPTLIWLGLTVATGLLATVILLANPELLGAPEFTEIGVLIVGFLTAAGAVRFLVRLYILKRMRYVVTTRGVRREYSLLYRTHSRELPLSKIRSHELRRGRIETVLGIGSVAFLSTGATRGMGHIVFDNVDDPASVREAVKRHLVSNDSASE
ncbi:PH domain-containing protein [Halorussus litoreus]|uniref:PH domain-containing protein n=1 Tax=Halorussus litoreus TaxID=1710536 RepID=UPI000E221EBF|nr:PH domain-containing protein [Halorussus litoreus]